MNPDFDAAVRAPFRMQPGLRRLEPGARQLTPALDREDAPWPRHLLEKLAVFEQAAAGSLLCEPGFDPAPALAALTAHAAGEHPGRVRRIAGGWSVPPLGWGVGRDAAARPIDLHALPMPDRAVAPVGPNADEAAGRAPASAAATGALPPPSSRDGDGDDAAAPIDLHPRIGRLLHALPAAWRWPALLSLAFEEDFAIVDAASGTIPWLAVALPSGWIPSEKLGRSFAEVHAPVADIRLVVQAGPALLRLVSGADRWERFVWTISASPRLDAHPQRQSPGERWPARLDAPALAACAFWRSERQTFIPLPGRSQAVFTIRVRVEPLAAAVDSPARAAHLHDALASMSEAVLAYRGLAPARDRLLDWLGQRAAGAPAPGAPDGRA